MILSKRLKEFYTDDVSKEWFHKREGQKIEMLFGEHILPNGQFTVDNLTFNYAHFAHLPFYTQKDTYICKGEGIEEWSPSFTYHGYRYVLVSGITEEQATKDLLQYRVMNTELNEIGNFSCSDPILNKLQKMVRVATLANFYHFPTDCPHREKNGWTADAALSVEHTLLNLTPENNYKEWEAHLCAALNEAGALPGIVPTGGWGFHWGNGPAWDQALLVIPYMLYKYRGDIECAKSALPSYEKDEKKQFAVSGLIQAYFYQLMDLTEEYYDYLDVREIEREP